MIQIFIRRLLGKDIRIFSYATNHPNQTLYIFRKYRADNLSKNKQFSQQISCLNQTTFFYHYTRSIITRCNARALLLVYIQSHSQQPHSQHPFTYLHPIHKIKNIYIHIHRLIHIYMSFTSFFLSKPSTSIKTFKIEL